MTFWNELSGLNAAYVLELYDRYLQDPASVDDSTRQMFDAAGAPPPTNGAAPIVNVAAPTFDPARIVGAVRYADAIRANGHAVAQLDPLGSAPPGDPTVDPAFHGVSDDDLRDLPASLIGGEVARGARNAHETIERLKHIYCSTTGYDFDHIRKPDERDWLRATIEGGAYLPSDNAADDRALLERLTQVETFEQFLHRRFPGKHRFSVEGLDMLVPILDTLIDEFSERHILIGMAHRGRLNVLAHTVGKPYRQILAEFKDPVRREPGRDYFGWTGDVKYHMGGRRQLMTDVKAPVEIMLAPNPSHLEFVNPVVEGMARAAGADVSKRGAPSFDPGATQPILIHGDAAFPGQGIVAETLNLSNLAGYTTGGTVHIITNNQLGFTTDPSDSRSTLYASDLAKGFKMPIVHVNADDPQACIAVARLAVAFIVAFKKDFVIDLIGYRRYGHNEGDDPSFTQPRMYQLVTTHDTVRRLWANTLLARGVIQAGEAEAMVEGCMNGLQAQLESLDPEKDAPDYRPRLPEPGTARRSKTAVPMTRLRDLNKALLTFPPGFELHPKLKKSMEARLDALTDADARTIAWATAEDLAFASILEDGISIRLTGQDAERGTFNQRHAVLHDNKTGVSFTPLQALPNAQASYEVHNSPLSEGAALGFEYGYNVHAPRRLVLWEAQYGDFVNGAQVILDEFIVSARDKYGQTPSLVLLLPHGYEGAGPDHSSARLERFLNTAANINLRVAYPTTAAQYFHLLRRQALLLESDPLPLIVMTPKSLLRNPAVSSSLRDLANGAWQPVIDDGAAQMESVKRLILCSGKVHLDLAGSDQRAARPDVAIARIEQLYPFPIGELRALLDRYRNLDTVVWAQEEPQNMGAWEFARPLLSEVIGERALYYVGRARMSSPAEGSAAQHQQNQAALVAAAYNGIVPAQIADIVVHKG
ncbi:MAG: 2-oxoglutarate dehydrogenase E1 component [Chloroflexota bacterium]|nr:2-oxoglutarate dehydrogenase E1 component [Chloroflexota bacterium]